MLSQLIKTGDLVLLILLVTGVSAATNDGITLAISPTCGKLTTSGNTADVNAGLLDIKSYKTIVSFGDSYTSDGKKDGSAADPAVVVPPNPHAGGRTTNGPVWIENIANDIGATFKDYAVASSVTDLALWPDSKYDFVTQLNTFLSQNNTLNPSTTLYTIYFGINDNIAAAKSGNTANLAKAAQVILDKIQVLSSAPTNGRSFLITDSYGLGKSNTAGDAYKKKIFNGLASLQAKNSALKFGFADLGYIWNAVLGTTPGYKAFGYTNSGACCLNSGTTAGSCTDPNHTFYWIPGHPSKQTHRIMGDYVEKALSGCH